MKPTHAPNTSFTEMPASGTLDHLEDSTTPGNSTLNKTSGSATVLLDTITVTLWLAVPPVLLVFGTFGNVMTVVVMRRVRASQSTACLSLYFTALAVSDQCMLTHMMMNLVDMVFSWPPSFLQFDVLCTVTYFVSWVCSMTSSWFLVAMTYQRVTSVVAPHRVNVLCTVRRGKIVIALIVTVACVLNLHFFFTFTYSPEYGGCVFPEKYAYFIDAFTLMGLFWASVVPFLLLLIGNSFLIAQLVTSLNISRKMRAKDSQQSSEVNKVYPLTMTLILTSLAYLILTLPLCVFDVYVRTLEAEDFVDDHFRAVLTMVESVILFIWFTASASNFYLYLLSGTKFREETKKCLGW